MSSDKMRLLNESLAKYHETLDSYMLDLQMTLAEFVSRHLRRMGWTQRRLAKEAGMPESFISRVLGGDNVELETVAKILHAMRVRARFADFVVQFTDSIEADIETETYHETQGHSPKILIRFETFAPQRDAERVGWDYYAAGADKCVKFAEAR